MVTSRRLQSKAHSCRLLTSDGKLVFSLVQHESSTGNVHCIDAHRFPLEGANGDTPNDLPPLIRTELPDDIQSTLEIDPAVELLCIEGESRRSNTSSDKEHYLPLLLLYARKNAFLLHISYGSNHHGGEEGIVEGEVDVAEPLDRHLSDEASIVRIRPAPQSSTGYAVTTPAGCFAALVENRVTCEYSLLLHHGGGVVTDPFHITFEYELEGIMDRLTDFCFAQASGELCLFPSMTVLLLKGSGDVFSASPVVFDGSVVSNTSLGHLHSYLQGFLDTCHDRNSPKWRQCKVAMRYLLDVFNVSENRNNFRTAKVLSSQEKFASNWPLKLQGPLLQHSRSEQNPLSCAIDVFGSSDCAIGVVIGKAAGKVDFAALSTTCLLPRFVYESRQDSIELDDTIFEMASFIERVDLFPNGAYSSEPSSVAIVKDPIADTLVHYVSGSVVATISTTALQVATRMVQGQATDPIRTTAWTCLQSSDMVNGAVVPTDASDGHTLIAGLQRGSFELIDVAEHKARHGFYTQFTAQSPTRLLLTDGASHSPLLAEELAPLIAQINSGLSRMGRIVGSDTAFDSVQPDSLAVAVQLKKRCDDEIVLPLLELKRIVSNCRASLSQRLDEQRAKVQNVVQDVQQLRSRLANVGEKMENAETNAKVLSERSSEVLQKCNQLLPSITQAEYDYFQAIKRLNVKCTQMEKEFSQFDKEVKIKCQTLAECPISESIKNMDRTSVDHLDTIMRRGGEVLEETRARFNTTDQRIQRLIAQHGTV